MTTRDAGTSQSPLDDVLLAAPPPSRGPRAWLRDAVDHLVGADPGLNQLRMALQAILGIGVGLVLAYLFVQVTGALQLPSGSGPERVVSAANHALLLLAMLLSANAAMQASFVVQERDVLRLTLMSVALPVPLTAGIALGFLVGPYQAASLAVLVAALTVAVYLRRFGPRGLAAGNVVFFGCFFGSFLHAQLGMRDLGWVFAVLEVGAISALLVRLALFRPDPEGSLERVLRSQRARARQLLALAADVLVEDDPGRRSALLERINRQRIRLNETTLMADAQTAEARPEVAAVEAQRRFETTLALENTVRFAVALGRRGAPASLRRDAAEALSAVLAEDRDRFVRALGALDAVDVGHGEGADRIRVLVSRFAASIEAYVRARRLIGRPGSRDEIAAAGDDFTPAVALVNGWLPGSGPVSTEASANPGRAVLDRAAMPPYVRTMIQIAVAGVIAVAVGYLLSPQRVYWAVLTVFVCFLAASNSAEQVRRAVMRAAGTGVGIVLGDVLVHVTGGRVWSSVGIVLVAMFFGIYLLRVNYVFLSIAITVMISQLYVQLGQFSWQILLLRLGETVVGVAAVVATVLVIVPLRPQRVLTTGLLLWFRSLRALVEAALDHLVGPAEVDGAAVEPLLPLARTLDAQYAALVSTAAGIRPATFGRTADEAAEVLAVAAAARQFARSLALAAEAAEAAGQTLPENGRDSVHAAAESLRTALAAIEERLATGEPASFVRSASLLVPALADLREVPSPLGNALRDLTQLDGTLAQLAAALDMEVTDLDTGTIASPDARRGGSRTLNR